MIQFSLRITDTYLIRYEFIRIGNDRLVSSIPLDPYLDVQIGDFNGKQFCGISYTSWAG